MLKNALFKKAVCITTIYAFGLTVAARPALAQARLSPMSFNQMYELAHEGDVESLRASSYRGMNIDATNGNGDTGLCLAARRRDVHAYNAFISAGANPYHPCTQNVSGYSAFVSRNDVIGGVKQQKEQGAAVFANNKSSNRIAPIWWWIGGGAIAAAVIWALAGHSSGGGGGNGPTEDSEAYNSLGRNDTTNGVAVKVTSGIMKNNQVLRHSNTNIEQIVDIDVRKSIAGTTYMDAILYVKGGGTYINMEDILLEVGPGTIGMTAIEKSYVTNSGYIKVDSYNASGGMVASEGSQAINYGDGIIEGDCTDGIALNFSGYKTNDTIFGMYADTASSIFNYGDIKGTAIEAVNDPMAKEEEKKSDDDKSSEGGSSESIVDNIENAITTSSATNSGSSASVGTMIGMEALIVNMGSKLNQDTINAINYSTGKIYLSAGDSGTTENEIKVSLVGMGSFLHNDFLNSSFNLNRAENVTLTNYGEIDLSYSGNYTASSATALRKGLGGIVGIRADANTEAKNYGKIKITLFDEYDKEVEVSAGMQSVHGGNLTNSGNITIYTPSENKRVNYGMSAVEGTGNNSSLYANINPTVLNTAEGTINIQIGNSYGMASFVGGTVKNEGRIILGSAETRFQNNIAMYGYGKTKRTELINTGTIDIYSHKSMAMQNDYSGGTDITNDGTIHIHDSATDSFVFGGAYSNAYNKGIINYDATATTPGEIAKDGVTYDPFKHYSIALGTSIISTKARTLKSNNDQFSSSTTEGIYNEEGAEINMNGSSYVVAMAVEANDGAENTQAKAVNNGTITIKDRANKNATNTIGMYMDAKTLNSASIVNNGKILTDSNFSIAMVSESERNADVINNGLIQAEHANSAGMHTTNYSNMQNNKDIIMNGDNSIGVYVGVANPSEEDRQKEDQSPAATAAENANSEGDSNPAGDVISGESNDETDTGILRPKFVNAKDARIIIGNADKFVQNSYGIYGQSQNSAGQTLALQVENNGVIDIYTSVAGAAVYTKGNFVKITNNNGINVFGDNSYGIYTGGKSEVINNKNGVINIGTEENPVSGSIAIINEGANTQISNKGDIHLYNKEEGQQNYAIYSTGANTEIKNEQGGNIYLHNAHGTGIYAEHGSIINDSTIDIENDYSNAIEVGGDATAVNDTNGVINVGLEDFGVNHSNGLISLDNATGNITNKGTINLWNDAKGEGDSHAILAGGSITVTNEKTGKINSYYDNSDIIRATGTVTVINNGSIYGEGTNVAAIQGFDEDGKEESELTIENTKTGIITIGKKGTNNTKGYGIKTNKIKTISNRGEILIHNKDSYGIYAQKGESITNDEIIKKYGAKIKMTGDNSTGIYGGAVTNVINNGIVETYGKNSKAISTSTLDENGEQQESSSQTITNTGDLILHNAHRSYAIYALGDVIVNSTRTGSIIMGYNEYEEPIDGTAKNAYGIFAEKASTITNDSLIKIYASGNGITGGETITNTGNIYLYGDNSNGIYSNGSTITNSGFINIDGSNYSYGIHSEPADNDTEEEKSINIINKKDGKILIGLEDTLGTGSHAIYAPKASNIQNEADLTIYARDASGITGGETITNKGAILIGGQDSKGISSNGTVVENEGKITINQAQDSYGIYTKHDTNKPTITNKSTGTITIGTTADCTPGDVNCAGNGHGIYSEDAQQIDNYADITVYAQRASGITGGNAIYNYSTNGKSGAIHIVGQDSNGIFGNKNNTSIYNEGKINVDDANGSFGIHADDTAETTIENKTANAKITIGTEDGETGTSAHGIYAVKATSITNEADITVYAQGDPVSTVNDSLEFLPLKASGITGGVSISNLGVIHVTGGEAHGIYGAVNNTSITNNNNILIDVAKYSYGIRAANTAATTIVNKPTKQSDNLTIVVGSEDKVGLSSHGIFAVGATSITNEAAITVYAEGIDLPTNGEDDVLDRLTYKTSGITGGQTITNSGAIRLTGGKAHGIYGAANNTAITNTSNIKINVAEFSFGIRTYKTAATTISNTGNDLLIVVGDETEENVGISSHGIFSLGATSITNEANIFVYAAGQDFDTTGIDDSPDTLIYKSSGITGGQTITNSGVIYLTGGKAHGIYGASNNTSIKNSNRIRIANAQDSYGIRTSDSAKTTIENTLENTGDDMTIIIGTKGVTEDQTNAHGIYSKNASSITNDARIDITAQESTGITGGQTITNTGKIHITGQNSKGIESGNATQITNSGAITLDDANNSYGIYVDKSAAVTITNNADGKIIVGAVTAGSNGHGIYAEGAGSITNNAEITVYSNKASGITGGQSITNNNTIHLTGAKSKGIEGANEKTTSITNTGKITIDDAQDSYGIYTVDDAKPTITNTSIATIIIGTERGQNPNTYSGITNGHGIYSANASSITNDANINVYASGNGGDIFASGITGGETLTNSGNIIVAGNYGHALETHGTNITNNGVLTVYGPNGSAGIYSTGSGASITNTKTSVKIPNITVGSSSYSGNTDPSYGIYAEDASSITNDGVISVYADNSFGIHSRTSSGQTIENRGDIYMPNAKATGIFTRGSSTITNKRSITLEKATNGYGIHSVGTDDTTSNITNTEDGIIIIGKSEKGSHAYGIYLEYGGTIRNDGMITIYASQSYGIYNTEGDSIINNALISLPEGDRSIGIFSAGKAMVTNNAKGLIVIGSDNPGINSHGIKSLNAQGVNNKANITVYAKSGSTAISGGGTITNSGELYVEGMTAKGIYSLDSTGDGASGSSSVINSGKITIPGITEKANNSFGIYATGNVSIQNSGDITVGQEGDEQQTQNAAAIWTVKGTDLENTGILRVYAQDPAWGIYGGKIQNLTNSGEIHMYGKKNIIGIYTSGEVTINNSGPITLDYSNQNYGIRSLVGPTTLTNTYDGIINIGSVGENGTSTPDGDKEAFGIYVYNAASLSNAAEINVYASKSHGIWTDFAESITNSGPITVPFGEESSGITSKQGKSITNSQLGKIIVGYPQDKDGMPGIKEYGIYAPKSEDLNNQADIELYGQGVAIYGHNQIKNSGIITIDNEDLGKHGKDNDLRPSKGIYSDGDGIDNDSTGKITITYSNKSIGIHATGETEIKNKADITIGSKEDIESEDEENKRYTEGENAYGIYTTTGTSIDNSGTIIVNAEMSTGIHSQNASEVKNSGNITLKYGANKDGFGSKGIYSAGGEAQVTNSGKIKLATLERNLIQEGGRDPETVWGGNRGIESVGSLAVVTNQSNGTIQIAPETDDPTEVNSNRDVEKTNFGIYAQFAESVTNQADIKIYTQNAVGIYVTKVNTVTNSGHILIAGHNSKGIHSSSSAKDGLSVDNSGAIHVAAIDIDSSDSAGIVTESGAADISNSGTINVGSADKTTQGSRLLGISIQSGTINNSGAINLYGAGTAIRGNSAIELTNDGAIYIKAFADSDTSYGIWTNGGTINNTNSIHLTKNGIGISGGATEGITNSGNIDVDGKDSGNKGIFVISGTSVTNDGNITLGAGTGIDGQSVETVVNSKSITINGNGNGITTTTTKDITNSGVIDVKGDGDGILTSSEGTVTNTGNIYVTSGHGIHAAGYTTVINSDESAVVIRQNGWAIWNVLNYTAGSKAKAIVEGRGIAVRASEFVNNSGTIATHNGNAIQLATTVTNNETGIIEVKLGHNAQTGEAYPLKDGPYDIIKYDDGGVANGIVNNNGYMHTEWGSIVRNAYSFTNGQTAKAIVNGLDFKTNDYIPASQQFGYYGNDIDNIGGNPCTDVNGGKNCENNPMQKDIVTKDIVDDVTRTSALYNVKFIKNDGYIENYWGPVVSGTSQELINTGEIVSFREGEIVGPDPEEDDNYHSTKVNTVENNGGMMIVVDEKEDGKDALKGEFGRVFNSGDVKSWEPDKLMKKPIEKIDRGIPKGAFINGEATDVQNEGRILIHTTGKNKDGDGAKAGTTKGVFNGTFGTIENSGTIADFQDDKLLGLTGLLVNGSANKFINTSNIYIKTAPEGIFYGAFGDIENSGNITNYDGSGLTSIEQGALVVGTADSFTNSSNIYITNTYSTDTQDTGVFQGDITTITNTGFIMKDAGKGAITGPFVRGNSDTVTNGGYVHVSDGRGAFVGTFQTIENTGTIINDSGPIIDSRKGGSTGTLINSGVLTGSGDYVIYKEGSFNLYNGGGVINGNVFVGVPNSTTKVVVDNEGGKINGTLTIYKRYAHYLHHTDYNGDQIRTTDEFWWEPSDDNTTVNPGETNGTYYCTTPGGCVAPPGAIHVNPPLNGQDGPNWRPIPVGDLTVMSASNAIAKPVKLANGKTVNVVMLDGSEPDIEELTAAIEKADKKANKVTAAHNSLIWTDDESILKNIMITNTGTINSEGDIHFGEADSESAYISVGKDGSYVADSFAGKLRVEPSVVQGGYETTYVNEDTLVGEDKGVEFVSQSYMFDASSQKSDNGNTSVVMTMKPFDETVDDAQISDYLATNYAAKHGERVFDFLKTARSKNQLYALTRNELGFNFVPNLAKQSLDIEQTVGRGTNDELLEVTSKDDRIIANVVTYNNGMAGKDGVVGYSDQIEAAYGFMDKDYDNGMRLGFGLEAIRSDSNFDDGSGRYNNVLEAFVPVIFDSENVTALVKPKAGYARGHYRREAISDTYKAKTKEYYYGVDAAVKKNYDLDWFELEPEAEFDVTGMYIDDINETNDGLHIQDKNVLSAQSVLSLQAKKKIKLGSHSALTFGVGGNYVHEFGDNYKAKASVSDMIGYYDIISNRITRDYGILNMKAQFDYRDLSLDASANMPMDGERKTYYMFNAKYKF